MLDENLTPEHRAQAFNIDVPHNLAPICPRCNGEKSDTNFSGTPRFMSLLEKARTLEQRVERRCRKFRKKNAWRFRLVQSAGPAGAGRPHGSRPNAAVLAGLVGPTAVADPTVARYSSASSAWLLGRRRGSAGCGRAGSETYLPMLPQMMG
jgi:hypothetical protein